VGGISVRAQDRNVCLNQCGRLPSEDEFEEDARELLGLEVLRGGKIGRRRVGRLKKFPTPQKEK